MFLLGGGHPSGIDRSGTREPHQHRAGDIVHFLFHSFLMASSIIPLGCDVGIGWGVYYLYRSVSFLFSAPCLAASLAKVILHFYYVCHVMFSIAFCRFQGTGGLKVYMLLRDNRADCESVSIFTYFGLYLLSM